MKNPAVEAIEKLCAQFTSAIPILNNPEGRTIFINGNVTFGMMSSTMCNLRNDLTEEEYFDLYNKYVLPMSEQLQEINNTFIESGSF